MRSLLFLAFFSDAPNWKPPIPYPPDYYIVYGIVFGSWIIAFLIIIYRINFGSGRSAPRRLFRAEQSLDRGPDGPGKPGDGASTNGGSTGRTPKPRKIF